LGRPSACRMCRSRIPATAAAPPRLPAISALGREASCSSQNPPSPKGGLPAGNAPTAVEGPPRKRALPYATPYPSPSYLYFLGSHCSTCSGRSTPLYARPSCQYAATLGGLAAWSNCPSPVLAAPALGLSPPSAASLPEAGSCVIPAGSPVARRRRGPWPRPGLLARVATPVPVPVPVPGEHAVT